jgi:CHAT domain-containing protein
MSYRGQYLVDGFSIFYLPSAGVLKYIANKKSSKGLKVLAFGNPDLGDRKFDLPDAEAEVESIRKIIPQTKILLRAKATKNKAKEMLENYDIIHFAAQGLFVEDAPLNSGLLLAGKGQVDGTLTANEIFKIQFKGRAVVMSACEAAPGLSSTGIEIPVFIRSFLYAGSPSVVATLWDAEDTSTAVFTGFFYKNIKKSENIADALNITQNEMIKLGYEPYHWAGFFVNGR